MKQLVSSPAAFETAESQFRTLIKTEITLKNGRTATALTLLTELGMFDSAVMGLNKSLKSDGCADLHSHKWPTSSIHELQPRL